MLSKGPDRIAIDPDDYHAKHVGWTSDARQFFLTTPFIPKMGASSGREFVALYVFNTDGQLLSAEIDDLGTREAVDASRVEALISQRVASLGSTSAGRIHIQPFSVERFGTEFGLIPREPESDEEWSVEAQPGNYMAFFEPWDSGEYDT